MSLSRRVFASLGCLGLLGLAASCSASKQTELVAGISTQVQVPRDLRFIRLDVKLDGVQQLCRHYKVFDGKVQLPRTLGSIPRADKGHTITFVISGVLTDRAVEDLDSDCDFPAGFDKEGTRILRRSKQPYISDKILFVPIPLKYSCYDKSCGEDQTCKAGRCVDASVDPNRLPEYREDLIFGNTSTCFSVQSCMGTVAPAQILDSTKCLYKVPGGPPPAPLPPNGLNVRAIYDGGFSKEILDMEAKDLSEEGYFIPDPAKPQEFQLAPGMCDLVKGLDSTQSPPKPTSHRISGLEVSYACNPKTPFQPICDEDLNQIVAGNKEGTVPLNLPKAQCSAVELKTAPSALLVLVEKSDAMSKFYSEAAITAALSLSLSDPAFQTTKMAMRYLPKEKVAESCSDFADPASLAIPFKLADAARSDLVASLKAVKDDPTKLAPASVPLKLEGALAGAYKQLGDLGPATSFNKRAVLVLGNHDFDSKACGVQPQTSGDVAKAGFDQGISTYVVQFGDQNDASNTAATVATEIAAKGSGNKVPAFDARTQPAKGFDAFYQVVGDLGACVYDQPAKPIEGGDTLSYYDPIKLQSVEISAAPSCTADGSGNGWGIEKGRIRICGDACTQLRDALKAQAAIAGQANTTPPAIPVFARKAVCKQ